MLIHALAAPRFGRHFGLLTRMQAALALRAQRRALLVLDAHLLADVGLTRSEALAEAARPVWDAPQVWLNRAR